MPQYVFGSGVLWSTVEGTNRTPRKFGALQEVTVDISVNVKELNGQYRFPIAAAQGLGKITIKAKSAEIYGAQWAEIMFGDTTVTSSQRKIAVEEAGTVPGTPYGITVSNSATWLEDLGVIDASTGLALKRVASVPSTGQYSVSAGVYTFASADTTKAMLISYSYTPASTGSRLVLGNQHLGVSTFFSMHLQGAFDGDGLYMKFYRCVAEKLSLATKLEDFVIPEFDARAFANSAGNVLELGFSDQ
mgnify:CR=1 FL=1